MEHRPLRALQKESGAQEEKERSRIEARSVDTKVREGNPNPVLFRKQCPQFRQAQFL
jgi:hypothetical protein